MYRLDLSRILSKWRVIAPAILISAANVYADCADCQAYKTQVVNDCDSILSAIFDINSSALAIDQATVYIEPSSSRDYILNHAAQIDSSCSVLDSLIRSIKSTAQTLQCSSTNSTATCDCSQYLQGISLTLNSISSSVASLTSDLDTVKDTLTVERYYSDSGSPITIAAYLSVANDLLANVADGAYALYEFLNQEDSQTNYNIVDFYNILSSFSHGVTNKYSYSLASYPSISYQRMAWDTKIKRLVPSNNDTFIYPFKTTTSYKTASISDILYGGFYGSLSMLASLNNYQYTNYLQTASIVSALGDIKNSFTNKPSVDIWGYVQEVDRPPLDGVSSQYYAHLTNEYLRTWSANDNPNTNWFRRVEILLASMVFRDSGHQDELNEIEEDLPSSSDLSSLENSLDASELFDVDIGGQFFDGAPTFPDYGSQLPQTLVISIPSFGGDNSQSASTVHTIEIDVNSISSLCDAIRACFRFLWWGLVALLVFFLGRWFLRGCEFVFKLIEGVWFS